jgi:uncharacterized membrane protein YcaP (DUF421 family)
MPADMFRDLFHVSVPIAEKILRPVIVYVFLVICLRIFGKREMAQLNPFDIVVLLSLSNAVQNAIIGEDNSLFGGLIGALSLLLINWLVIRFLFRHRRLDEILAGKPTVLVEKGRLREKSLAKEFLSRADLLTMAHRQGFKNLKEIETCIIEPGGTVFLERKDPPIEERRQAELLARIDQLSAQIEILKSRLPG